MATTREYLESIMKLARGLIADFDNYDYSNVESTLELITGDIEMVSEAIGELVDDSTG